MEIFNAFLKSQMSFLHFLFLFVQMVMTRRGSMPSSIFSCIGSVQGAEKECDESRGENISEMRLVDHCLPMIPPDYLKVLRNCPIHSIFSCILDAFNMRSRCRERIWRIQTPEVKIYQKYDKLIILDHYFDVDRNRKWRHVFSKEYKPV